MFPKRKDIATVRPKTFGFQLFCTATTLAYGSLLWPRQALKIHRQRYTTTFVRSAFPAMGPRSLWRML